MKPERILISVSSLLLVSGFVVWGVGGAEQLRRVSVWLWLGAFAVLSLPLLASLADAAYRAIRRQASRGRGRGRGR